MSLWQWVNSKVVEALHEEQIAEHGGLSGIRDSAMLHSALQRPQDKASYGSPDVSDLAAGYAFGIARNHPFLDGNKRAALVTAELFLELNDFQLDASDEECVLQMLALAAGDIEEAQFATWLRENSSPINDD